MATLRSIVHDALRENGLVQVGTVADSAEYQEALRKLKTIINGFYGSKAGIDLVPISYGTNGVTNSYGKTIDKKPYVDSVFIPLNVKVMSNLSASQTLYLHPNPRDGARFSVKDLSGNFSTNTMTVNGNGRLIENGSSVTLNEDGTNKYWFYRADLGDWVLVNELTENDESPFPAEFDELLITSLSMRLNPRYLSQTAAETAKAYRDDLKRFTARYRQPTEQGSELALRRLGHDQGWGNVESEYEFNYGNLSFNA